MVSYNTNPHCIRLYLITIGDMRYNIVYPKGRKRWIIKKLLEDKDYSHLDTLLDDVITLRLIPSRLDIHNFEQPDNIPKNIALSQRPPKQEVIDAHITRFTKHPHTE